MLRTWDGRGEKLDDGTVSGRARPIPYQTVSNPVMLLLQYDVPKHDTFMYSKARSIAHITSNLLRNSMLLSMS